MAQIKWLERRIRFGCDTTPQIEQCERAMSLINKNGYKGEYFLYTMIGGKNDFKECYHRLMYWWRRNQEERAKHKGCIIYPYAQPYRDPYNNNANIPQWQKDMAQWCNKKMVFELCSFDEFRPRNNFKCSYYNKNPHEVL